MSDERSKPGVVAATPEFQRDYDAAWDTYVRIMDEPAARVVGLLLRDHAPDAVLIAVGSYMADAGLRLLAEMVPRDQIEKNVKECLNSAEAKPVDAKEFVRRCRELVERGK